MDGRNQPYGHSRTLRRTLRRTLSRTLSDPHKGEDGLGGVDAVLYQWD